MKKIPLIIEIIIYWLLGVAVWHFWVDFPLDMPFKRWQWLIAMYVLNFFFIFGLYRVSRRNRNAPFLGYMVVIIIGVFFASLFPERPTNDMASWLKQFKIGYLKIAYPLIVITSLLTILSVLFIALTKMVTWCVYKITTWKGFTDLVAGFYAIVVMAIFYFFYDRWDFVSGSFFPAMMRTICILAILSLVAWLLWRKNKTRYIPQQHDPWLPKRFSPRYSPRLIRAMKASLETDDIDEIITDIEYGLRDLHTQKQKAEKQLQKWRSVPKASDEEYHNIDGKGRHLQGRSADFSRYEIAGFENDLMDTIGILDEAIKETNERYNHLIKYAPKLGGISRPKTLKNIEGLTLTPMEEMARIEGNQIKKLSK